MVANPLVGVTFHGAGGVLHGTFYAPLYRVQRWSWESYWLVQGVAAWALMPWLVAILTGSHPVTTIISSPRHSVVLTYMFGVMWGFGSLTFGLTMRYLGMSLGMAVALGCCSACGTLIPPWVGGQFPTLFSTTSGLTVLAGVGMCLAGIGLCGRAGMRKDSELTAEEQRAGVREFDWRLGLAVAVFSGIMSASFAYGISAGKPIAQVAYHLGAPVLFSNSPVFILVMAGGLTVNGIWCLILNLRNRSARNYVDRLDTPLLLNYGCSIVAGAMWYTGFFFYGMGTTLMGRYDFSSWSIHLSFVIVFSTLCGIALKEWRGTSRSTLRLLTSGIAVLLLSTVVTGLGNYLATRDP